MPVTTAKTKQKKETRDLRAEALKIARSIKTEGQTPTEIKAIANGVQRGMMVFLRQQSEKTRDLDKRSKKVKQLANQRVQQQTPDSQTATPPPPSRLPWVLLALSWGIFLTIEVIRR